MKDCSKNVFDKILQCENVIQTAEKTHFLKCNWKKGRQYRITGCSCYEIFTYSRNNWSNKARKYFWTKDVKTIEMHHGMKYEPVDRQVYQIETRQYVKERGLIVLKTEPWLACSPDGTVVTDNKPVKLIEIKYPYGLISTESKDILLKWKKYIELIDNKLQLKKKNGYYAQIEFVMCLLNLTSYDFIIYSD